MKVRPVLEPNGYVVLRETWEPVFDLLREYHPRLDAVLFGPYDPCYKRYRDDPAFRNECDAWTQTVDAADMEPCMGLRLNAASSIHVRLHAARLCAAQCQIDEMHAAGVVGPRVTLMRIFMDMHLLSALCLGREDGNWTLSCPLPMRFPWYGNLPSMAVQISGQVDFHVTRRNKSAHDAATINILVNKMAPCRCAKREITSKIEEAGASSKEIIDIILDIVLIVLLGNYPGASMRSTMMFARKMQIVAGMMRIASLPKEDVLQWMKTNDRFIYFCMKIFYSINLQHMPTLWEYYSKHFLYDSHYGSIETTFCRIRRAMNRMPDVAPLFAGGGAFETFFKTDIEAGLALSSQAFMKLRKGSFAYKVLYLTMRGHLIHVEQHLAGNKPRYSVEFMSGFLDYIGDRRTVFWKPGHPHPVLDEQTVEVLDALALVCARIESDWPMLEFYRYMGAPDAFLAEMFIFFMGYETCDTPDNSCVFRILQFMNRFPRECMMLFYVQERIAYVRAIDLNPLPVRVVSAARDALRRRYRVPISAPDAPLADLFAACRECRVVYNFVADERRVETCNGKVQKQGSNTKRCGSNKFTQVGRNFYCRECGTEGRMADHDNMVLGWNLADKSWCRRVDDDKMGCMRCGSQLLLLHGLGYSIYFYGKRYEICVRCGAWTTYDPRRMTSDGLVCGCDSEAPMADYAVTVDSETDAWFRQQLPPQNGHACLVCDRQMEQADAQPVFFLCSTGALRREYACVLHAPMNSGLWDEQRVRAARGRIGFDSRHNMIHMNWDKKFDSSRQGRNPKY